MVELLLASSSSHKDSPRNIRSSPFSKDAALINSETSASNDKASSLLGFFVLPSSFSSSSSVILL